MTRWTETGRVAEALRQPGIETWEVREVREVSPNHDGVILTQALARGDLAAIIRDRYGARVTAGTSPARPST